MCCVVCRFGVEARNEVDRRALHANGQAASELGKRRQLPTGSLKGRGRESDGWTGARSSSAASEHSLRWSAREDLGRRKPGWRSDGVSVSVLLSLCLVFFMRIFVTDRTRRGWQDADQAGERSQKLDGACVGSRREAGAGSMGEKQVFVWPFLKLLSWRFSGRYVAVTFPVRRRIKVDHEARCWRF
ncbi:hypothetical protein M441DRAFT_432734 [Trichoderma asperellum CBS 433.97]|uniref:Uncharacterized protein n=1 Tax=Trichoderma asperellum (strain ATCC 204424 / CBS 433.97 / NBRC 101777) TaxID=1042311 RepID=A0A2T3Z2R5_TRIA4|nr:hypothetical protein M441DRAFT_432734 [Trichoderma asperellum CBS 433.97]PTB39106.1 hypothetical protein M441DRAFT_432734 [Trichoderma asperellum CBS 433.97]